MTILIQLFNTKPATYRSTIKVRHGLQYRYGGQRRRPLTAARPVVDTTYGANQVLRRDKKRYRDDALYVDADVISTPRKKREAQV